MAEAPDRVAGLKRRSGFGPDRLEFDMGTFERLRCDGAMGGGAR